MRQQRQGYMAIPSSPLTDLILVQTYFPNSLFKADFNRPATACNAHQIGEWLCAGGVGMIIDHFVRQTDTASCNEPMSGRCVAQIRQLQPSPIIVARSLASFPG